MQWGFFLCACDSDIDATYLVSVAGASVVAYYSKNTDVRVAAIDILATNEVPTYKAACTDISHMHVAAARSDFALSSVGLIWSFQFGVSQCQTKRT